jgi:hypothetical protein
LEDTTLILGVTLFGFALYASFGVCRDSATKKRTSVGTVTFWGIVVSGFCFVSSAVAAVARYMGWPITWTLSDIATIALVLFPLVYVIAVGAAPTGSSADQASRTAYFDALKTMITASGVAIAVVSAGLQPRFNVPVDILKWAVGCLIVSIVASVVTMFILSYFYDVAGSSGGAAVPRKRLVWALASGYVAIAGFLLGFSYLARIPFHIQP